MLKRLFGFVLAAVLIGCSSGNIFPGQVTSSVTPMASFTQAPTATPTQIPTPTVLVPTATSPVVSAEHLPTQSHRLPSGWTTYTNPDFVTGVAVHGSRLWASSKGGIVVWDLIKKTSRLFTTRDGLVEIQGNDIVYCEAVEEQIFVAHEESALSAYRLSLGKWNRIPITFEDGSTMKGVRTLFCDAPNNRLLAGSATAIGILNLETGRWERFGESEGLRVENLQSLDVVGRAIWVAAEGQGAFLIMGESVFPFNGASGFPSGPVNDLAVAADQSIWLGYPTGLVHYRDRKWNPYGSQSPAGIPFRAVDKVEVGPDGRVWIAGKNEGACPFDPVRLKCSTIYPSSNAVITDLTIADDGTAYVATEGAGVLGLNPEGVQSYSLNQGLLVSNDVLDISESQDGLLWVVTDRGINILDPENPQESWQVVRRGNSSTPVQQVGGVQPAEGGMWLFSDQDAQASFYSGQGWSDLDSSDGLPGPVRVSAIDWMGRLWFGTDNGLMLWSGGVLRPHNPPEEQAGSIYQAMAADQTGMWVGTDRGLLRFERYQWQSVLAGLSVNTISDDQDGDLLLGTDIGLVRFKDQQTYLWIINLGEQVITNPAVTSIAWDGEDNLWVGTMDHGALYFNGSQWEQFDASNGMPSNTIRKVFRDRLGTIWFAAVTGQGGGALVRFVP